MIRQVGDTVIQNPHRASCHCGAVVLELQLPDGIVEPQRCNCSLCRRRGAVVGTVQASGLRVVQGQDVLALYQFHSRIARHYFCSRCGVYTHHYRRMDPQECGYNIGCLEGVDPFELGDIPVSDGIHHPADQPRGPS